MVNILQLENKIMMCLSDDGAEGDLHLIRDDFNRIRHVCVSLLPIACGTDAVQRDDDGYYH